MKIRSLFLSDMPPDIQTIRRRTVIIRWIIFATMVVFSLLVIVIISARTLDMDNPVGHLLYSFHDNVFLVLRGEIFAVLIYPFGFIALFLAIYLGLFVFIPWLFAFSFIGRAYHVVWGKLIGRVGLHPFAVQFVRLSSIVTVWLRLLPTGTAYRGDVPRMIAQTHRQELRMQLWGAIHSSIPVSEQLVHRYITMLRLTIRLETRLPEHVRHIDSQLQSWHLGLLLLQLNHGNSQVVDQMTQAVKQLPLQQIVNDTPSEMLDMFKPSTLISRLEDILSLFPHAPISPNTFLDKVSRVRLVDGDEETDKPQLSRYEVINNLVEWVEDCTTVYTDLAYHLQSQFEQRVESPEWRSFPDPDNMPISYTVIGQMVFQMTVHIAFITQQTQHAIAFVEAQQALILALDAAQAEGTLRPDGVYWLGLVDGASQPDIGEMMYPYEGFGILGMLQHLIDSQRNDTHLENFFTDKTIPNLESYFTTGKLHDQMGTV